MRLVAGLLALTMCTMAANAQTTLRSDPIRVFLDCGFCDVDYLQVETPWMSLVRDPAASDVHLLLTRIETGSGGDRYQIEVLPQDSPRRDTLTFNTGPTTTGDTRRKEITRNIQLALVPYAIHTEAGRTLRVTSPASADEDEEPSAQVDPWRAWVFEVGGSASMRKEQRQSDANFDARLQGRRITAAVKLGFDASADYDRSRFELDEDDEGGTIVSKSESYDGGLVAVRSIGRKWGLGAEASASSSTFRNTSLMIRAAPAIEYSVWPYEEATRRQLVFQYSVGVSSFTYREETIFDKLSEVRPNHTFVIGYDVRQPWGSADASLEAAAYLDDMSQNRLELDAGWNVRLFEGLELNLNGSAERIHDQLSIPKRDATPEEILLERRALATDYRYDFRVGLSYTFGSIFRPVVNPRFGSGPGDILR